MKLQHLAGDISDKRSGIVALKRDCDGTTNIRQLFVTKLDEPKNILCPSVF
jgi:hypothetical protein